MSYNNVGKKLDNTEVNKMRKLILFLSIIGSLVLMSCSSIYQNNRKYVKIVNYVCPMDTTFTVKFYNDLTKVDLETAADEVFTLTNKPLASGAYYSNVNGVSFHSKGEEAIIEIVKNKPIECTVFKK